MTPDVDPPLSHNETRDSQQTSAQASKELRQQCVDLLGEIDEFQSMLNSTLRNPQIVELRQFRSNVNSEFKMLQRLEEQMEASNGPDRGQRDPDTEMRFLHALRSSNLPFYQAVWSIARGSCAGLFALGKRFYWDRKAWPLEEKKAQKGDGSWEKNKQPNKDKRKSVFVDIVADDGESWVKVSTISESRLLFDMAKKGWERDSDSDTFSDEDGEGSPKRTVLRNFDGEDSGEDSDDDELELIKLARDLRKAADATRVRYRHPRLRIVLPKIEEGNVPEIDDVLKEMRSYGIKVECQDSISANASQEKLSSLLPQPFRNFTTAVNIDCTLLLAIVSDLSHVKDIVILPSFHKAIVRQIEVEKEQPLLPTELWPAMGARELLCTKEAAKRMCEIVETIGTATEKERMYLVLGNAPNDRLDRESLIRKFQSLSDWQVPADWALPIRIVDAQPAIEAAKAEGKLPPVSDEVAQVLSDINHSVFMYGWAASLTTISSNRTIDKQIEVTIENSRQVDEDDVEGPQVWICDTARSLVGKDKGRK
ncbi:hypothetical protein N7481_010669 [Penicillium waksmanii]|uniref:uncharacterized protein n=1 Tax=Penicillium waksmanii TaxID=69791 RepID=UPI00254792C4|nr:uncharacterized protein N7481_010669 [Penicillium waksmanii]KAJ5973459.1 hypothetical protein N7481_010669 [Penicillium waksmanii]